MTNAIEILWWAGLIAAVVLTVPAAGYLLAICNRVSEIASLAERTVPAAEGIESHTSELGKAGTVVGALPSLLSEGGRCLEEAGRILEILRSVERKPQ